MKKLRLKNKKIAKDQLHSIIEKVFQETVDHNAAKCLLDQWRLLACHYLKALLEMDRVTQLLKKVMSRGYYQTLLSYGKKKINFVEFNRHVHILLKT